MARPKGLPKTGGRKAGTKNKKTDLFAICDELNLDVFKEMATIAASKKDPDERFDKLNVLAPYLYAKKKEVDLNLSPTELLDLAEQKLNEPSSKT